MVYPHAVALTLYTDDIVTTIELVAITSLRGVPIATFVPVIVPMNDDTVCDVDDTLSVNVITILSVSIRAIPPLPADATITFTAVP